MPCSEKQNKTKMATLFALPACQSWKNKLHPRKTNTHTANTERGLLTRARRRSGPRSNRRETARRCAEGGRLQMWGAGAPGRRACPLSGNAWNLEENSHPHTPSPSGPDVRAEPVQGKLCLKAAWLAPPLLSSQWEGPGALVQGSTSTRPHVLRCAMPGV